jgi:hypothetical protein
LYEALRCYEVVGRAGVARIPRLSGSKPSYTKIFYNILPHPLPSSPYREHTKNTRFTKTLCFHYYGKTKQMCSNVCIWSSGECDGWPVNRHEPLDTTPPRSRTRFPLLFVTEMTVTLIVSTPADVSFSQRRRTPYTLFCTQFDKQMNHHRHRDIQQQRWQIFLRQHFLY